MCLPPFQQAAAWVRESGPKQREGFKKTAAQTRILIQNLFCLLNFCKVLYYLFCPFFPFIFLLGEDMWVLAPEPGDTRLETGWTDLG